MKTTREPGKLICLRCEHTVFAPAESEVTQEFRGETFVVRTPVMRCAHCGWETLGRGQLDPLRVRTADAYRCKHGLLTSAEIRQRRVALRMSQREFAAHLGVGQASIPRWETWQVQEPVYDLKIREKTSCPQWNAGIVFNSLSFVFEPSPGWKEGGYSSLFSGWPILAPVQESCLPGLEGYPRQESRQWILAQKCETTIPAVHRYSPGQRHGRSSSPILTGNPYDDAITA